MTNIRDIGLPVTLNYASAKPPPTGADAVAFLEIAADLPPKQCEDRIGAVWATVRICCPNISSKERNRAVLLEAARGLPMDCAHLNAHLFRRSPAAYGISLRRFDNIVSLLRDILRRMGQHAPELPRAEALLPAWQDLYDLLTTERRKGMIGFMGYSTLNGILPSAVDTGTVLAFEAWSITWTLHRDPQGRARRTASNWNWASRNIAGWPATRLALPSMRDEYTLPLEAYPASFQLDVEFYLERLGCRSEQELFPDDVAQPGRQGLRNRSPRSRREPLRDRTLSTRRYQIRQAAAALVASGIPPASLTLLRGMVQPVERVRTILSFHRRRTLERRKTDSGGSENPPQNVRTMNLAGIGEVLRQIAVFHCARPEDPAGPLPEKDITKILAWVHSVTPEQQVTMTDANMLRLRVLMEPQNYAALMHLPEVLLRQAAPPKAEEKKRVLSPRQRALLALYAVALEILTICPLRRDSLARLRLDRNLRRARPGGPITHLYLSGEEVKNRASIHWPIPPESAWRIEDYLRQHRPLLTEADNPFLFPNGGLGHRAAHDLAVGLTERVERDVGVEFNLHLMRHLAVLVYLNEYPGQYEVVSRILGHKKVETTKTFYAGLEADAAVKKFLELIAANRKGTRLLAIGAAGKALRSGRRR